MIHLNNEQLTALVANIQRGNPPPKSLGKRIVTFIQFLHTLRTVEPLISHPPIFSPSQIMQTFVHLILKLLGRGSVSCDTLYLLIDGIDEYALTQEDPDASAELLYPLLGNLHFLEISGLAVKFFLPSEQRLALERITRVDRLNVITLIWEPPETEDEPSLLRQLLRRRIAAFNTRGLIGLGELCDPALRRWIEDAMLEEAHDSPRSLMRLGSLLFAEHCRNLPEPESLLLPVEWERAAVRFRATVQGQAPTKQPSVSSTTVSSPDLSPSTVPRLRVDLQSGKVFRGNKEIPPLADLEYRLLTFLYRRKGQICTKDEIALAVYEPRYNKAVKQKPVGISDEAISRLLYRLRKRIEPSGHDKPIYIKTIKGRGYRLDNAK